MKLSRALEMCGSPVKQSRSHMVKLDRYALTHVLDDREQIIKANAALQSELDKANADLEKANAKLEEMTHKFNDLTREVEGMRQPKVESQQTLAS
jgi:DNA repair exonuclease SbcCD ATPase subunit